MSGEAEIKKHVERIDKKLSVLLKDAKEDKTTWVKASVITRLTGWNYEKMRLARANGYVKYRRTDNKIWYSLESLNPVFYKEKSN
jgi:predicted mannosyl-3-phosphoglycerate phosphatase (HAD superfamily)